MIFNFFPSCCYFLNIIIVALVVIPIVIVIIPCQTKCQLSSAGCVRAVRRLSKHATTFALSKIVNRVRTAAASFLMRTRLGVESMQRVARTKVGATTQMNFAAILGKVSDNISVVIMFVRAHLKA